MGDRIVVIEEGVLQQVGTPDEIFNSPVNVFVARFIGSPTMNFTEVEVFDKENKLWIRISNGTESAEVPMPEKLNTAIKSGSYKKLIFGIRPQHILYNPRDISSEYILDAKVLVAQPRGTEVDVEISSGGESFLAVFPPKHKYEMNENIKTGFNSSYFYLFDIETGKTIS